jgi:hypothetical protein
MRQFTLVEFEGSAFYIPPHANHSATTLCATDRSKTIEDNLHGKLLAF